MGWRAGRPGRAASTAVILASSLLFLLYLYTSLGSSGAPPEFRQPAPHHSANSVQRGLLKQPDSSTAKTQTQNLQEPVNIKSVITPVAKSSNSLNSERVSQPREQQIFEVPKIKKTLKFNKYRSNRTSKAKKPRSLFGLADFRPGNQSAPFLYGMNVTLARLNQEFSAAPLAVRPPQQTKLRTKFDPAQANTMEMVGNLRVGQQVPTQSARQVLVATTWRSGSTFLGDLLNHYRGTFYYFEPLHYFSSVANKSELQLNQTSFLKSLLSCQFNSQNVGFLHHVNKHSNRFLFANHNFRLWEACKNVLPSYMLCLLPEYVQAVCSRFPIRLIKTVRLRLAEVEPLLTDAALGLKVVFLVRDPRGTYNSRSAGAISSWCNKDQCADPVVGCRDLLSDITAAHDLERRFPGSVTLVRYEDLSMFPEDVASDLLDFLDLPFSESIANFIETHTHKDKLKVTKNKKTKHIERKNNPYGTTKNSTATAFAWREKLSFEKMKHIQEACWEPMMKLGYKILLNAKDMKSQILPIEKKAEEIWPFK